MSRSYAIVIAAAIALTTPLLICGVLPVANDRVQHQSSDLQFRRQLAGGAWYPRWLAGANASLGSPGLFVYSPLPYWVSASIDLVTKRFSVKQRPFLSLDICAAMAFVLSGVTCLLWLRSIAPAVAATVGSVVYL